MKDQWGAFRDSTIRLEPSHPGTLSGLTFAVKDVFDIQGHIAGAGSPDWKRTHHPAERNAEAIDCLLRQGARLIGTTQTDELMFSLNGENYHYGTPINPKAAQHIPGGSSSGSAVAVSARLADFALGTDTGGSVRIPASYCGIYGFRPTYGSFSTQGVVPLAPSFDTVGLLAIDPHTMLEAGAVLSGNRLDSASSGFNRIWIGDDLFAIMNADAREAVMPIVKEISSVAAEARSIRVAGEGLEQWMNVFRLLQGADIWRTHQEWINRVRPRFGPGIAERFNWSSTLQDFDTAPKESIRKEIRYRMREMLAEDSLLLFPTAPGPAPLRNTQGDALEEMRKRTLMLCCIAGLAGLPQITLPWASLRGLPLGISVIAGPNQDLRLLAWVKDLSREINATRLLQV